LQLSIEFGISIVGEDKRIQVFSAEGAEKGTRTLLDTAKDVVSVEALSGYRERIITGSTDFQWTQFRFVEF